MGAAAHLATDQPGASSTLMCLEAAASDMAKGSRKLAYRSLAAGEIAQHPPARGIAEGMKDGIEPGCL